MAHHDAGDHLPNRRRVEDHTGPIPRVTNGPGRHSRGDAAGGSRYYDDEPFDDAEDASYDLGAEERPAQPRRKYGPTPPAVHAHSHQHAPAQPASRRVRRLMFALVAPMVVATLAGLVLLYPGTDLPSSTFNSGTPTDGTITAASAGDCANPGDVEVDTGSPPPGPVQRCVTVKVRLTEGAASGKTITKVIPDSPGTPRFAAGDPVVLAYGGGDANSADAYQIVDFQRGMPLLLLVGLFALAVLALSRWKGVRALTGLALSFAVIALFILPAILAGEDPLLVAIVGAGAIMFATLYLTHGFSVRTSVAVLGTLISLGLIGVISAVFSGLTRLTGLDEDTTTLIGSLGHGIDARGLLLAGVVIGAMGVLDDVTVTQSSAVWELHGANSALGVRRLYAAGVRIGRDHVAAAVNTLVLAYAGAALPLMLYSAISGVGIGSILGSQGIAQEILRTLAGSIGIIAAVPVTTLLAALIVDRDDMARTTNG